MLPCFVRNVSNALELLNHAGDALLSTVEPQTSWQRDR